MEHNERRNQGQESQGDRSRAGYGRDNDRREFSDDRFGSQRYDEQQQREPRRGGSQPEDVYSHRPGSQEFGSPYGSTDDRPRERNFGRHERDYGGSDAGYGARRGYEDQRYRDEQRFSPDWSRDDAQPRQSDDPYYARNRGYAEPQSGRGGWRGDENRTTTAEQRARGFEPRGMQRGAQRDPDREFGSSYPWGSRGSEARNRQDEDESYYRGYYSRQYRPFSYPGGSGHLFTESWTLTGPHTGRGPKGWKRSDQQIIEEASQRLERDGDVDATDIEVQSDGCVITLRGTVPDRATKRRAEECVESIYGVRDVMNELRVASRDDESRASGTSQGSQQTSSRSQRGRGSQASQSSSSQTPQSSSASARSSGTTPSSASQASQAPSSDEGTQQKH